MRLKIELAFPLLALIGVTEPGFASEMNENSIVSDGDLAAVRGGAIVIALHANSQNGRIDVDAGRYPNFPCIETVSTDTGQGSISQAGTSLQVRATLTLPGRAGL